ncbi:MAG: hypothetical protein P9L99_16865 [Candidatus Lernaella stagnicola]|nr:hypothetical protein [Candidatus Lernaella stagnicola]
MSFLKWALILGGVVAAFWLIDRLLLYCEARGWLYYRKKTPAPGAVGSALMELHSILEPEKTHMAEQLREEHAEVNENGEPIIPEKGDRMDEPKDLPSFPDS